MSGLASDFLNQRLRIIWLAVVAGFFLLAGELIKTQIFAGGYYRGLAQNNRVREISLPAPRGIIFDRNKIALTVNLPAFRLVQCDSSRKECLTRTLSKKEAIRWEAGNNASGGGGVLVIDSKRWYPQGEAAAHVLGYLAEATDKELARSKDWRWGEEIGRGGVEEQYEQKLRGIPGKELVEVDATGKKIRSLSKVSPVAGENLTLTIDGPLQKAAYEAIKDKKGVVVVSRPATGEILALAVSPSFDGNILTGANGQDAEIRSKEIAALLADPRQPFFNRGIAGSFPPGSTFKVITAVGALEEKAITKDTQIEDVGALVIGPYKFPNWKWLKSGGTEGWLNIVGAIQKSNDIFFYKAGERLGVEKLTIWAKKFGLGEKLGIDLPGEAKGLVPDEAWREATGRQWYLGDTYHLAIGQGDLLVTPLQVNAWTSVIASGGRLCRPHVLGDLSNLSDLGDLCEDLGIRKETIDLVRQGMVAACSPGGTAWPLFNFKIRGQGSGSSGQKEIQIACKTGTAEYGDPQNKTHAWLTGYAPADNPEVAVTVLIEGGGEGSDVAAPVAKEILQKWFER